MNIYRNKTLGGILLVAGTSIGAGMLALPITTGVSGFYYSASLFVICFLYMLSTLFLLLEANCYSDQIEANIISMAKDRLGPWGEIVAWLAYLLLLYSVAAAYMSGGGSLVAKLLQSQIHDKVSTTQGILVFVAIFGFIVYFGTRVIDSINRLLMAGLLVAYLILLFFLTPHVQLKHLEEGQPQYLWAVIPVVILSFTSHLILPSMRTYMKNNVQQLKKALFFGSLVPLVFYLLWQFLILGVLPNRGVYGLDAISQSTQPLSDLTHALSANLGLAWIAVIVGCFSFFALVTSFFGVSLSVFDFLADGFGIKKNMTGRVILIFISVLPPLLFALYYPHGFVLAISYAGVFVAVLYGILPVLMVWKARYREHKEASYQLFGGKFMLSVIFLGALLVIFFQVAATLKWLPHM